MLLWGKMCAYLLSKDTFYYSASIKDKGYEKYIFWCLKVIQNHRKKIWVSTVHHVGEINCQTLKKTDSFWNNIPPGKCDPYIGCRTMFALELKENTNSVKVKTKCDDSGDNNELGKSLCIFS